MIPIYLITKRCISFKCKITLSLEIIFVSFLSFLIRLYTIWYHQLLKVYLWIMSENIHARFLRHWLLSRTPIWFIVIWNLKTFYSQKTDKIWNWSIWEALHSTNIKSTHTYNQGTIERQRSCLAAFVQILKRLMEMR